MTAPLTDEELRAQAARMGIPRYKTELFCGRDLREYLDQVRREQEQSYLGEYDDDE